MKTALIIFAAVIIGFSLVSVTHAVNISLTFPSSGGGSNPCSSPTSTNCSPGNFINYFYQFALMIGGLLAFGVIVYGGVRYATSAGNPSGQHEAKEWVQGALLGLVLLAGAYLILYTVNPNLVQLGLPTLHESVGGNGNELSHLANPSSLTEYKLLARMQIDNASAFHQIHCGRPACACNCAFDRTPAA